MARRFTSTASLSSLIAWLRRAGPVRSLLFVLLAVPLLFFGCIQLTEGTRWGRRPVELQAPVSLPDRQIRVRLLGRTPLRSADLSVTSTFSITQSADGKTPLPENGPIENVAIRPSGKTAIQLGSHTIPSPDIILTPSRDAAIVLNGQTYRGRLRILRSGDGLIVINQLDIEAYLRGVLRGELPKTFHPESFKAQCVAARTYAIYQKNGAAGRLFDVYDDEGSQMYMGVRGEDHASDQAAQETIGEVCTYSAGDKPEIFCTYYSSTCGGLSQNVNNVKPNEPLVPPLAGGVECPDCANAKFYRWGPVKISKTELTKKLTTRFPNLKRLGLIIDLVPKSTNPDGRIVRIDLIGAAAVRETLVGEDFRLAVGGRVLKSTNLKIEKTKDAFVFKDGKGFGHGLGLCQYGMEAKARRGMDYRRILLTYYPGAQITKLY